MELWSRLLPYCTLQGKALPYEGLPKSGSRKRSLSISTNSIKNQTLCLKTKTAMKREPNSKRNFVLANRESLDKKVNNSNVCAQAITL